MRLRDSWGKVAVWGLVLGCAAVAGGPGGAAWGAEAGTVKDAESASHAADSAAYQVVDTYTYPGFSIVQFTLPVLSHYSYILVSGNEALVVDPGRDIFAYLEYAREKALTIRGVFLTHSHADFVAGHTEMAAELGCPVYISAESGAGYAHTGLSDGTDIPVGQAVVKAMATPGHTLDSMCGCVYSPGRTDVPAAMFTGDMLFVGSVGRPDLMGGTISAAALAGVGFDSWTQKLSVLDDGVVIFPAHGAGSLCGAHLSDEPSSTIGAERIRNPYLQHKVRSEYIAAVLDGLPEAPQYFKHNAAMNREGPPRVDWTAPLPPETPPGAALTDPRRAYVVDLRDAAAYAEGHIPSAVNIGLRGRLETWVGIMTPWDAGLVLCGRRDELQEATRRLHRVGYKGGVITLESWREAGLPLASYAMVEPRDLYDQMRNGTAPVIVDVRLPNEWMALRIGAVLNIPLNHLAEEAPAKLDPAAPLVAVCNSAYRSSMAVGVLERVGFTKASSMNGGSEAWIQAGLPVFQAEKPSVGAPAPAPAPAAARRVIALPDRISAQDLARLIKDLPGTFDLVDIRPADQFQDYAIPGARNVDLADLVANPAYLTGAGPLIIVDRDGSVAMAVGGILAQKTQRVIKVLLGGLEAYWRATEVDGAIAETPMPGGGAPPAAPPAAGPAPMSAPPPSAAPAAPAAPKTKSAGC